MPIIPASSLFAAQSRDADANKGSSPSVFRQGASDIRLARLGESSIGTLLAKSLDKGGDSSEKRLDALRTATREAATFRATRSSTSSPPSVEKTTDDAATFTIRDEIQASARTTSQAKRNVDLGVSLVATADSALTELTRITKELKTLAEQAADTSTLASRREALDREAQALKSEYARIIDTTEFNGEKILKGGVEGVRLQVGGSAGAELSATLGGRVGTGGFDTSNSDNVASVAVIATAVTGDFNGDGNLDIAKADSVNNYVKVSLGDGTGSFSSTTSYAAGGSSLAVTSGDFNGDGNLDIAATNYENSSIDIIFGDGTGSFGAASSYSVSGNPRFVTSGDLNNDGVSDLAVIRVGKTDISILQGTRSGTFLPETTITSSGGGGFFSRLADFNNDGFLDIASSSRYGVFVNLNDGAGGFLSEQSFNLLNESASLLAGDFNADGNQDILSTGALFGDIEAFLGDGNGSFGTIVSPHDSDIISLGAVSGDFNGDNILDFAHTNIPGQLKIRLGDGTGRFGLNEIYASQGNPLAAGDFNNDGVLDLARSTGVLLGETRSGTAPLLDFSLETVAQARQAVTQFTQKLDQLSVQQGAVEGLKSRLTSTSQSLVSQTNELLVAQDRIQNISTAQDSARTLRLSVINEATNAIRAQGLLQPDIALGLLV